MTTRPAAELTLRDRLSHLTPAQVLPAASASPGSRTHPGPSGTSSSFVLHTCAPVAFAWPYAQRVTQRFGLSAGSGALPVRETTIQADSSLEIRSAHARSALIPRDPR